MKKKNIPLLAFVLSLIFVSINCGTLNMNLATPKSTGPADTAVSGGAEPASTDPAQSIPTDTSRPASTSASLPTTRPGILVHAEPKTILDVGAANVLWSPDGKWLYAGGDKLHVFDAQSLAEVRAITTASQVSAFAVSPDGKILAVVDGSYGISLIDSASGSELRTLPRSTVSSGAVSNSYLAFTPDGAMLAAIVGEVVKLYSVATGEETGTIVATSPFNIAISPDGANLYAAGWMDEIQVWDIASGEKIRTFGEKSRGVNRMVLSPDGSMLASAGTFTDPIILWDAATGRQVRTFSGHTGGVTAMAFSPDGRLLASAAEDVTIKLWDVATGQTLQTLTGHTQAPSGLAISPDGTTLASAARYETTRLWALSEGAADAAPTAAPESGPGPDLRPTQIPFSSRAMSVDNAAGIKRLSILDFGGSSITAWSPDGKWLVVSGNKIHFLNAANFVEIRNAPEHFSGLAISPDSRILAALGYNNVTLFDLSNGAELRTLAETSTSSGAAYSGFLAFSPDSATLAVIVGDVVKLYDVGSGGETGTLTATGSMTIAISPDGRRLYAAGWGTEITVWDIASRTKLRSFGEKSRGADRIALSFDGNLLASAGPYQSTILWDAATGRQLRTFSGHTDSITAMAFSPGGTLLFTAARDVTIKVWDIAAGTALANLVGHTRAPESIAVSPDGATLASAANGDGVFLWGLPG